MKKLIRTILKETVDNRIVDVLIKLNLTNHKGIMDFLLDAGYNEIECKEIYSNYFETISGMVLTPKNWMNYYFNPNQLKVVKDDDSIFFKKNGKVVMKQDKENKEFGFDNEDIWSFFELYYGMEYHQIKEVLLYWLEDTLKLNDYTPFFSETLNLLW